MLSGFKAFIARGNVLDLAVAVIIGAAFTKIVTSLTEDVIMPLIGRIAGDIDFSQYFVRIGSIPATFTGDPNSYAALKAAGVAMIGYGAFVTAIINFLIVAFFIYLIVSAVKRALPAAPEEVAGDPADVVLLREIRDELKAQRASPLAKAPEAPPSA